MTRKDASTVESPSSNGDRDPALELYLADVERIPLPTPEEERNLVREVDERRVHLHRLVFESGIAVSLALGLLLGEGNASAPAATAERPPKGLCAVASRRLERCRALLDGRLRLAPLPVDPGIALTAALRSRLHRVARSLGAVSFHPQVVRSLRREIAAAARRIAALERRGLAGDLDRARWRAEQVRALATAAGIALHLGEIDRASRALADAKGLLCLRHLRTVFRAALRHAGTGPPLSDLVQEGNTALVRAAERFRPRPGRSFRQFARARVKEALGRTLAGGSRLIRGLDREPLSLDEPISGKGDGGGNDGGATLGDRIPDPRSPDPARLLEEECLRERVEEVLRDLTIRERNVLRLRFGLGAGTPHTIDEVARILRVSRKRVRRIQAEAIRKLSSPPYRRRLAGLAGARGVVGLTPAG